MKHRLAILIVVALCFSLLFSPHITAIYNSNNDGTSYTQNYEDGELQGPTNLDVVTETTFSPSEKDVIQDETTDFHTILVTSAPENFSIPSGEIDYVIIIPVAWQDALDDFVDIRSKSYKTLVYNVENITQAYEGRDDAEKIRNFLQELYNEHNLKFVLLVGDVDYIPIRYVFNPDEANDGEYGFNETYKPTDLYYSCLKGNWDIDEDGVYGESSKYCSEGIDEVEWEFNVAVGRIPANSIEDVQHYIDKVLHYETTYGDWLNRMLFIGAISNFEWEYPEYGATDEALLSDYVINATVPSYINVTKLYESTSQYHSYSNASKTAIFEYINSGTAIINFAGHGTVSQLLGKTDPDNDHIVDWKTYLSKDDLDGITHTEAYSFFYAFACLVNAIDAREVGGYGYDSLGEQLILKENGGAIGLVGSMRRSWYEINILSSTDRLHNYLFWRTFFEGATKIGECLLKTKDAYLDEVSDIADESDRKQLFTYILLGDPVLDLWTKQPDPINAQVMGNTTTVYGGQRITVNVTNNQGDPISYARISIMNENVSVYATTDEDGIAYVYTPRNSGHYEIYAKGHNTEYSNASIDLDEDFRPPKIHKCSHTKSYTKKITITVNATDYGAGIKNVYLVYNINDSIYNSVNMLQDEEGCYTYSLGTYCRTTNISYSIYVYDGAGNSQKLSSKFTVIDDVAPEIVDLFFGLKRYDSDTPFEYYVIDDEFQGGSAFNYTALYYRTFQPNEKINLKKCNWTKVANGTTSTDKVYGKIPRQPYNTTVYYKIIAKDVQGNQKTVIGHYVVGDLFAPYRWHERVTVFGNIIKFTVNATEPRNASGVERVTLHYSTDKKHWNSTEMKIERKTGLYSVELDRSQYTFSSHFVLYWAIRAKDYAGKINDFPKKPNILFIHLSSIEGYLLFFLCMASMYALSRSFQLFEFFPKLKNCVSIISTIRLYLLTFLSLETISRTPIERTATYRKLLKLIKSKTYGNMEKLCLRRGILQIHPVCINLIRNPFLSLYSKFTSMETTIIHICHRFLKILYSLRFRPSKIATFIHSHKHCFSANNIVNSVFYAFLSIVHIPNHLYNYCKKGVLGIIQRLRNPATALTTFASCMCLLSLTIFWYAYLLSYQPQVIQQLHNMFQTIKTEIYEAWNGIILDLKSMTTDYNPASDLGWLPLIPRFIPLNIQLLILLGGIMVLCTTGFLVYHIIRYRKMKVKQLLETIEES